jgi:hypothetical protein
MIWLLNRSCSALVDFTSIVGLKLLLRHFERLSGLGMRALLVVLMSLWLILTRLGKAEFLVVVGPTGVVRFVKRDAGLAKCVAGNA